LGLRLTDVNRYNDALAADSEATQLLIRLSAAHPDRYAEAAEKALANVVVDLRDLGRNENDIQRELATLIRRDDQPGTSSSGEDGATEWE
jgi:hypothetical protein